MKSMMNGALVLLFFMGSVFCVSSTGSRRRKVARVSWHGIEMGLGILSLTGFYMTFTPFKGAGIHSWAELRAWGKGVAFDERAYLILLTAIAHLNSCLKGLNKELQLEKRYKQVRAYFRHIVAPAT